MNAAASPQTPLDPVALTKALIACPSVTPEEGGALGLLEAALTPAGFRCQRVDRGGIANLFARWGDPSAGPSFAFAGHTDVVPVGDRAAWSADPFGAEMRDGALWGRGAVDMKSGVAAFVAASVRIAARNPSGSIALLITGDEEGDAEHGTRALLDWMASAGERIDACVVGEPTSLETLGDVMKIGRRGSLTADIVAQGRQGHTAYPDRALNPVPPLVRLLDGLARAELDAGSAHFQPSHLALTTIDVGNPASNVIPAQATARMNLRFNDAHHGEDLVAWIEDQAARVSAESGVAFAVGAKISGEAFLTEPGALSSLVSDAVEAETGSRPAMTTGGGTSDARFIKDVCPVVEFGLVGTTMHQVDEHVPVDQIVALERIYGGVLERRFAL